GWWSAGRHHHRPGHRDPRHRREQAPETPVPEAYSGADLATVAPDTVLEQAAELMRSKAIRRLPVVDGGRPAGIVSIGNLAIERDDTSALADISAAESNR
ncbi:MAG: CBS domain-containing protein, partial [Actinomycetota bacterium]|nr:CBS domain-containing protein [Actinomycetota bacterium]